MQRKIPLISALALLLAAAGSLAMAQNTPPPPGPSSSMQPAPPHGHGMNRHDHGHAMGRRGFGGPGGEVIANLHALARLYIQAGRAKDLPALYNEVLAKSQDPRVRNYAYQHLARAQAQPANVDAAIATLRKSLDENLANEAKQRAFMEKMRATWQHKHTPPSATH